MIAALIAMRPLAKLNAARLPFHSANARSKAITGAGSRQPARWASIDDASARSSASMVIAVVLA